MVNIDGVKLLCFIKDIVCCDILVFLVSFVWLYLLWVCNFLSLLCKLYYFFIYKLYNIFVIMISILVKMIKIIDFLGIV